MVMTEGNKYIVVITSWLLPAAPLVSRSPPMEFDTSADTNLPIEPHWGCLPLSAPVDELW